MFLLEEIANDLRLSLAAMQVAAHIGHHLSTVGRAAFPQRIGFDILNEQFIGIEFRAVARQTDQAKLLVVGLEETFGNDRAVHGMTIDDQVYLARRLPE